MVSLGKPIIPFQCPLIQRVGTIDRGHVEDDENVDRGEEQHRP